jgi:membrane associated rhomboid family serine protease
MVGASGAISGVMGAYLVLYPHARVNMLFIFVIYVRVFAVPAWMVLVYWFAIQALSALPQLAGAQRGVEGGVAFMAHLGGFVAGAALIKLFENRELTQARAHGRARRYR